MDEWMDGALLPFSTRKCPLETQRTEWREWASKLIKAKAKRPPLKYPLHFFLHEMSILTVSMNWLFRLTLAWVSLVVLSLVLFDSWRENFISWSWTESQTIDRHKTTTKSVYLFYFPSDFLLYVKNAFRAWHLLHYLRIPAFVDVNAHSPEYVGISSYSGHTLFISFCMN